MFLFRTSCGSLRGPDEEETAVRVRITYHSGKRIYPQIIRMIRDMINNGQLPVGKQISTGAQMRRE
jgi:hypothetical protein